MSNPVSERISRIDPAVALLRKDSRVDWVRLRTLMVLRWLAVAGQTATILVATFVLGLSLELWLCLLAIGASVVSNLIAMFVFPENHRLSDREAMLTLLFDLAQLAFLLFLAGGLHNPFALLILAPVTISAAALTLRSTLILGALAIAFSTCLAVWHLPLRTTNGDLLQLPGLFVFGFWVSLVIGIMFLSVYARRIASETHRMSQALLATQMALAREQKLTDLGGVVAAAAHELGTPLATIKLVSTELVEELQDQPELAEDAALIRQQADRCRDILQSMGRAGKDDLHLKQAPFGVVVREAAEPHADRGISVHFSFEPFGGGTGDELEAHPHIARQPELIHGIRNLIQNAVDFAESRVWIEGEWSGSEISLRISDDGPGYPLHLMGRLGEPFLKQRARHGPAERPGYDGMGLGLFIAKTLLERSGAKVSFENLSPPVVQLERDEPHTGAIVEVRWPRARIAKSSDREANVALGPNELITQ